MLLLVPSVLLGLGAIEAEISRFNLVRRTWVHITRAFL
jgi:hypothetical protein